MWRHADISTVPDIVRHWAERTPGRAALRFAGREISYAELDGRSSLIARAVVDAGTRPGGHVGFLGRNSPEFFEAWFGATKAGAALAPFNWRCTAAELAELIDDAGPSVVLAAAEFAGTLGRARDAARTAFEIVTFDPARRGGVDGGDELARWLDGHDPTDPRVPVGDADTALLAYTSGTTGRPKGVRLPHGAFDHAFRSLAEEPALCWTGDDVLLMVMPNFHLAGSWVSLPALYHGATVAILPMFEPSAMLAAIERERPTVTCLVPAAIQMLLEHPAAPTTDFSALRSMIYAGSPISADTLARALRLFGSAMNQFYGTTETWIISLLRPDQHDPDRPHTLTSCGSPMPFVEVRVLDADGHEVPDGEIGEFHIRTPVMFSGYHEQPEATAAVLREGWYRTGDLGRRDADGLLYVVDRVKDMIITGGENVYSVEVERALARHPEVASVAVVGLPDERWGERVAAFVTLLPGASADERELTAHCRELIAGYKVPKSVSIEDALPTTPSGKIQKAVLRDRAPRSRSPHPH
jgi:acyl-CoA synthetase (AMP-forming)/AMP-acid ligase II